ELHDRTLSDALAAAARDRVRGKASTPYLLDHFHRATAGASLKVNVALALANVALAAQIAVALAG
ncbi:MAG: pseudouridine-5-phosphate glycosidase, partial [Pseudonocardiales bacterium]